MTQDSASPAPPESDTSDGAARAILESLAARRPGASICPADAARHLSAGRGETGADAWRRHLAVVRRAAGHLARRGEIDILRKGRVIDPAEMRGVIRLRLPERTAITPEES